jgi:carboxyl-terminal processing protease
MRRAIELAFLLMLFACGSGGYAGSIGVVARREGATGRVIVVEVPAGGAGARAGLEVGDEIIAVDDRMVSSMTPDQFRAAVRGPVGTPVTVEIIRDGARKRLRVERAAIKELPDKK